MYWQWMRARKLLYAIALAKIIDFIMTSQLSGKLSVLITFIFISSIIQYNSVQRRNIGYLNEDKKNIIKLREITWPAIYYCYNIRPILRSYTSEYII